MTSAWGGGTDPAVLGAAIVYVAALVGAGAGLLLFVVVRPHWDAMKGRRR
jgi:hypothetical protein